MTDEELDKYFATYVPLSNLPTPPPAKEQRPQHAIPAATTTTTTLSPAPELQGMLNRITFQAFPMSFLPLQDFQCWKLSGCTRTVRREAATIAPA